MSFLSKIFCKHKWKTHNKAERVQQSFHKDSYGKFIPSGVEREFIREVLICEHCGKIKTIEY